MLDVKIITFLKVCEHMNFTRAAEELHLTQPAVSKHIHALEQHYQITLFEYRNRKLYLTEQGEYFKNVMNSMNHDTIRMQEELRNIGKRRRIHIGATLSIGSYYLPERLVRLLKEKENLDVTVTIADTKELLTKLDRGELAFILCEGNFKKTDYEYRFMKNSSFSVFCGKDYDTMGIRCLEDLFLHPIVVREKGSGTREIFENYLKEKGYSLASFTNYHEISHPELILRMVENGLGISVLYEEVGQASIAREHLKTIELEDFNLTHEFNAVWPKGSIHSEEYIQLVDFIIK